MVGETVTAALEAEGGASAEKGLGVPPRPGCDPRSLGHLAFSKSFLQTQHRPGFSLP